MWIFNPFIQSAVALSSAVLSLAAPLTISMENHGIFARGTSSAQCAHTPDFLAATLHGIPNRKIESSSLVPRVTNHLFCGTHGKVYIIIHISRQVAGTAIPSLLTQSFSSVQSAILRYHRNAFVPTDGFSWKGSHGYTFVAVPFADRGLSWRVLSASIVAVFSSMEYKEFGTATVKIFNGLDNQVGYASIEPS